MSTSETPSSGEPTAGRADDGARRRPPDQRRAIALIAIGAVLLLAAGTVAVVITAEDSADTTSTSPTSTPTTGPRPTTGTSSPDSSEVAVGPMPASTTDWSLVLSTVGAATGVGSLSLGVADFARNSLRHRRATSAEERDSKPGGDAPGYL